MPLHTSFSFRAPASLPTLSLQLTENCDNSTTNFVANSCFHIHLLYNMSPASAIDINQESATRTMCKIPQELILLSRKTFEELASTQGGGMHITLGGLGDLFKRLGLSKVRIDISIISPGARSLHLQTRDPHLASALHFDNSSVSVVACEICEMVRWFSGGGETCTIHWTF